VLLDVSLLSCLNAYGELATNRDRTMLLSIQEGLGLGRELFWPRFGMKKTGLRILRIGDGFQINEIT